MKKIIALLLILSLVATLFVVPTSAAWSIVDTTFAVASDLHYELQEDLEWFSEDPIFGYANRRAAMENESRYIIAEFLNQCADNDKIEFVLIPGDISNEGRAIKQQHLEIVEMFRKLEQETGKQIYVINGNHDAGKGEKEGETSLEDFREIYYEFGFNEALSTMEGNLSYTADLNEKYRLIASDSCDINRSTGDGMTEDRVEWVINEAEKAMEKYNNSHIPNAKNIPKIELVTNYSKYLNKNDIYYIYCDNGYKSKRIVSYLNSLGFNTVNINGGFYNYLFR